VGGKGRRNKTVRMRIRKNRELIRLILAKAQKLEEDHIILFALLLKVLENLSLRDLEEGKAPRPHHLVV